MTSFRDGLGTAFVQSLTFFRLSRGRNRLKLTLKLFNLFAVRLELLDDGRVVLGRVRTLDQDQLRTTDLINVTEILTRVVKRIERPN